MGRARLLAIGAALAGAAVLGVYGLGVSGDAPIAPGARPDAGTPQQVARGAYLAKAGNCEACHTARGGAPYAGGRAIVTPFGTVYGSNLTPDAATGIGRWSAAHFWRALHHGRSFDGRLLTPAFPYPEMTRVTRADSDALYAYLRSLSAVAQPNRAHELRFPFNTQAALAVWRALFFRAGVFEPDPRQSATWNRGAYLVGGLGHCGSCHGGRNGLGAAPSGSRALAGGLVPLRNWYAPALDAPDQAGVADWPIGEIVALLRDGIAPRGAVLGPMAEVVRRSTQHLDAADLEAIAVYLKALPQQPAATVEPGPADPAALAQGERLYGDHCSGCHGDDGAGTPGRIPALRGSRTVTMSPPANLVRIIVHGGYLPTTAGNPRPFGMPPFAAVLNDAQVAALSTWLRRAFGHRAGAVGVQEVRRYRDGIAD